MDHSVCDWLIGVIGFDSVVYHREAYKVWPIQGTRIEYVISPDLQPSCRRDRHSLRPS